ncbi:MAG: UDP-N-acetylmuramyl-tripeptide synthetase, partial [Bacilli bacterium]|nr:UDP-N-acetylmuramyl-tripeptide synthetase [Bacilli bacterium]
MKICDLIECSYDIDILGITDDSRDVENNYLFVATKGFNVDHFDYIDDAIEKGASFIISDRNINRVFPHVVVDNINDFYIELCSKFYNVRPDEFNLIGITGTDGKTTTSTVIAQLIKGMACIGTNGVILNDEYYPTNNTTPCVSELYNSLNLIKGYECKDIVMEVSSESLLHKRIKSFKYDVVCFTNITEDHLNVHKTIENYRNCKFSLLDYLKEDGFVVVNGDDENCKLIDNNNVYKIGVNSDNDFVISDVKELSKFVKFTVVYKDNIYKIKSPLLGLYNVYNVTMAFAVCLLKGMNADDLIKNIFRLNTIRGRREYLNYGQSFDIILDYAHTYNGIKSILDSVSNYKKIITVTGAAGGREKEKRSKIGK